jgi:hypothetical protein
VSLSGTSKQLPTLIMYENGRECARIPHIFADGSVAKGRYRKVGYPAWCVVNTSLMCPCVVHKPDASMCCTQA